MKIYKCRENIQLGLTFDNLPYIGFFGTVKLQNFTFKYFLCILTIMMYPDMGFFSCILLKDWWSYVCIDEWFSAHLGHCWPLFRYSLALPLLPPRAPVAAQSPRHCFCSSHFVFLFSGGGISVDLSSCMRVFSLCLLNYAFEPSIDFFPFSFYIFSILPIL